MPSGAEPAGVCEDRRPVALEVLAVRDTGWGAGQEPLEALLTFVEGARAPVLTVEFQEVAGRCVRHSTQQAANGSQGLARSPQGDPAGKGTQKPGGRFITRRNEVELNR
jgi:hypothetical protein